MRTGVVGTEGPPLVVHVVYRLDYGGLENGLVNLINAMPTEVCRHAIVCLAGHSDFRHRIRRPDVEIHSLDKRPGKDLGAYLRFWKLLRRLRPSIVHTRNLGTIDMQWVSLVAGARYRIHGEHGWDAADPRGANPHLLAIRRACRPAIHAFVAVSADIAQWLATSVGVASRQIYQIYNGVDTDLFSPDGAVAADRPWSGTSGQPLVFATVGRLNPIKNQMALITAFARLVAESSCAETDLRLMIVGDGPSRGDLMRQARALEVQDRVWFAGARDDVASCMRACDIFVLPSLNEGTSNTLLEAMASGRPVIASRVGGNPELIEHGTTGLLYDMADADGLHAAMAQYRDDASLRLRHGQAARERVLREFSMARMQGRYADLYRQHISA